MKSRALRMAGGGGRRPGRHCKIPGGRTRQQDGADVLLSIAPFGPPTAVMGRRRHRCVPCAQEVLSAVERPRSNKWKTESLWRGLQASVLFILTSSFGTHVVPSLCSAFLPEFLP